jgi:hypothetical protein
MANNGKPSYLIIGLEDGTFANVGSLSSRHTTNDLNQLLVDKIDPPIAIRYQEFSIGGSEFAVIEITGYNPPYIVAKDVCYSVGDWKQTRVHQGTIYVRHKDRTQGISRAELDDLLNHKALRKAFEDETEAARQIAFNRPSAWEYRLTAELLRSKAAEVRRGFTDLERGLVFRRTTSMKGEEFIKWATMRIQDLISLVKLFQVAVTEEIPASWGPPGVAGDPLEIKRAVNRVDSACRELLEWESELRYIVPPPAFTRLKELMAGCTAQAFNQIESLPAKLLEPLGQPNAEGEHTITLV